jgi:hypothetical protein
VRHTLYITGYRSHIQNRPHDCRGPAIAHGSKEKPTSWVSAASSEQIKGRSNAKGGQQLEHPGPHLGDPRSSIFISVSWSGRFLHALCGGCHLAVRVFPIGITRERHMKPPGPNLTVGTGASSPIWSYEEALALASSHTHTVT